MITKEQQLVYDWINDQLGFGVFAGAYIGAVEFLHNQPSGYITFVSHASRDIMNFLASSCAGKDSKNKGYVDYPKHIDIIAPDWADHWGKEPQLPLKDEHSIPHATCVLIRTLVNEHEEGKKRSSASTLLFFQTFLDYSDTSKIPDNFLHEFKSARKWFVENAHCRAKPFDADVEDKVKEHFKTLDNYLYVAAQSAYNRSSTLDEILEATN
jgi:hypothetical protein